MEDAHQVTLENRRIQNITFKECKEFINSVEDENWFFTGIFEVIPIKNHSFSVPFQASYWYIQYHLLRDKRVAIDVEMLNNLTNEEDVFFDTITIENNINFRSLSRNDGGDWLFTYSTDDIEALRVLQNIKQ